VIILLKRLFRDEAALSSEVHDRICAALGAIFRMNPEVYTEVVRTKLGQMLAETNAVLFNRSFKFLGLRSECWRHLEHALVVRLEGAVDTLSVEDLIKYDVAALASTNQIIDDVFQVHVGMLESTDTRKLMEATPTKSLRKYAISTFLQSGSFDSAYSNGTKYLLPHVVYFSDHDLRELLEGVVNYNKHRINQLVWAGGIDKVYCQVYLDSKVGVASHAQIWKWFFEALFKSENKSFDELTELLIRDGVVKVPPPPPI
jgi:hypothetical protein